MSASSPSRKTFVIVLRQLVTPGSERETRLAERAAARLEIPVEDVLSCEVVRRSTDARRRRGNAVNVYHVRLELPNAHRWKLRKAKHLDIVFESGGGGGNLPLNLTDPSPPAMFASGGAGGGSGCGTVIRPLVVGLGPAGLFAALRLARAGWKPLVIDRGDDLEQRRRVTADFWRRGILDPESNPLFGAGGAGLFSDGKLNTRHKDRETLHEILRNLVHAGAPESILTEAEPHIGSDLLGDVVANLIREIRSFGGEVRFRTRLADCRVEDGALRGVVLESGGGVSGGVSGSVLRGGMLESEGGGVSGGALHGVVEEVPCSLCVLAVGHSARDVYGMLHARGALLEAKPFAVGVRVEMPQEQIDASQRGGAFAAARGQAASFRLSRPPEGCAGSCYTFCMCPGGQVIACASESGHLAVNGMSLHARAGEWGNAAFLSPVGEEDFARVSVSSSVSVSPAPVPPALAGIAFQRFWEEKAFLAAGGEYAVPGSRLIDFLESRAGELPEHRGVARAVAVDLGGVLPGNIAQTLRLAIPPMLKRMRFVKHEDVLLYAIETRTSSPVRIVRGKNGGSPTLAGIFPAGEGSGYAGGIMTSALDGWKAAGCLLRAAAK